LNQSQSVVEVEHQSMGTAAVGFSSCVCEVLVGPQTLILTISIAWYLGLSRSLRAWRCASTMNQCRCLGECLYVLAMKVKYGLPDGMGLHVATAMRFYPNESLFYRIVAPEISGT